MTNGKSITLPDELFAALEKAAQGQSRTVEDVLTEAAQKYLDELSWQAFVGKAEKRNRAAGRTDEDVARLISENRKDKARRR